MPEGGKTLKCVFRGRTDGTLAERIASHVMSSCRGPVWVELRGGDIHEALTSFLIDSDQGGREVVERSPGPGSTFLPYQRRLEEWDI